MRELGKRLVSGLAGRRVQEYLLKAATYPRFDAWRRADASPLMPGADRVGREALYALVLETLGREAPLDYWEFGVHEGGSFRWWLREAVSPEARFHGFDSFRGLPEDWLPHRPAGSFDVGGKVPEVTDDRARFHKGWFHETLPGFVASPEVDRAGPRVLHLDADLYRSTLYVLLLLGHLLRPGDVLIFDEMMDSIHEFRAFEEFLAIFDCQYRILGHTQGHAQVAVQLV